MSYPVVVEMDLREATSELHMVWSDGHRSRFALTYLRGWCPCARCQGHFTEKKVFIPSPNVRLLDVQPVGNYAFQPSWSDGHTTGIYAFDYLREIDAAPPSEGPTNAECLAAK